MNAPAPFGAPSSLPPSGGSFQNIVTALQQIGRALWQISQNISNTILAQNSTWSGNNIFTGTNAFQKPVQLATYTVATLPAVTLPNVGSIAYATDGRNTGEGAAGGTGCVVQVQNKAGAATWCAVWSGVAVAA